jgi:hypothetical protein
VQTITTASVADAISDGETTIAPSQNAVFDALVLKANLESPTLTGAPNLPIGTIAFTQTAGNNTRGVATTAFVTDALVLKEDAANKSIDGTLAANSDTKFPTEKAVKTYVDLQVISGVPDATTTVKGKVQLAGDLAGTAVLPIVKGVNGVALSSLSTGLIKNTTTTGVPVIATIREDYAEPTMGLGTGVLKNTTGTGAHTIAVAGDFPTLNQNTTGTADNVITNANLTGPITSVGNATSVTNGAITNDKLAGDIDLTTKVTGILPVLNGGTGVSSSTGTGNTVLSESPTFTGAVSGIDNTMVGLGNVDNTSDANKPISTATQAGLDLKENAANKSIDGTLAANSDTKFPTEKAVKTYVDLQVISGVPEATTTVKGKVQLAGDLAGTAALPIVKGVNGVALSDLSTGLIKNTTTTGVPVIATIREDYAEPTMGLGTGILKNTTGTGAHTIAVAGDFPTLNQNTTGTADNVITNANLTGPITSVGNATSVTNGAITNDKLAGDIDLTSKVTGILPVLNGGTGVSSSIGTGNTVLSHSPTFTGTPTLPTGTIAVTQGAGNNTTAIATTAFVQTITTASAAAVYGHVTGNTLQPIPNVTPTDLTTHWDGTPTLSGGVTFASGVFTVPTAGFYQITASFSYSVGGGGARSASIRVNNSTTIGYQNILPISNDRTGMNLSAGIYLNANSNVRILAYQGSVSSIDINNAITGNFSIVKIGN